MKLSCMIVFLIECMMPLETPDSCTKLATEDGIEVFKCKREDSKYDAVRATFEVDATPEQYASIVLNIEEYPDWNFGASNPRVLRRIGSNELIYYVEARAPWPVKDRYVVLHLKMSQDPASRMMTITLKRVPNDSLERKGMVQVEEYSSVLNIVPVSQRRLHVSYLLEIDPGGTIPAWLVNKLSTKMPINGFLNLKRRLRFLFGHEK